ncbi:type II secretion system F family protein [Herbaspirillum rhizosphaerae]|uniref:type II secretion system F family protein n=1 Tax=Herbaspirillum rhizosphaerae TaxID=346179 RepID=UPI00067B3F3E|nr:type II secretion system F family protein [Herbaspirillum rhizosphaerae]
MATSPQRPSSRPRETLYAWEGKDRSGRTMRGEMPAGGTAVVSAMLRRQGIRAMSIRKKRIQRERRIGAKELALFTRQLATMLKAGVPLLQAFGIVERSQANPALARLIHALRADVEGGASLNQAFARHPRYFNALFSNLVAAGEQAGLLDEVLDSLAHYQEKTLALRSKVRAALTYPAAIVTVALLVTSIIMIWVVPTFKDVFSSFGAELPLPTRIVIALSDFMARYWWVLAALLGGGIGWTLHLWRRSADWRARTDRVLLRLPVFGKLVRHATIARWSRTLATLFSAGIPLIDALQAVGAAAGNAVYADATTAVRQQVAGGASLTAAIEHTRLFPDMVGQMVAIGEESGALDRMLLKVADFYDMEVTEAVASLSNLMEPFIMVVLGVVIGGLVIAMYLPIFKLGSVI